MGHALAEARGYVTALTSGRAPAGVTSRPPDPLPMSFQSQLTPVNVERARITGNTFFYDFFAPSYPVTGTLTKPKEQHAERHTTSYLPGAFAAVSNERTTTDHHRLLLHHDQASTHSVLKSRIFLDGTAVTLIDQLPCSLDLALYDSFRSPK
ncbi:hypothetical protein EVAR_18235_1 [Eumeta japonica]|uniref:Mariner Mos1 transposase n=1 Tax=Eumeta variegata TaxID=151549 RepID=A0A4C1UJJ3_EUMVA|nr:hypothetical protein EVAR_18235_1 [Eumeta japonica]